MDSKVPLFRTHNLLKLNKRHYNTSKYFPPCTGYYIDSLDAGPTIPRNYTD